MEFDAGMRGPCEASTSEDANLHAEVTAVLLSHQVGGSLRSAEERMQRAVDAAIFRDAVVVLRAGVFPTRFELLKRAFHWARRRRPYWC